MTLKTVYQCDSCGEEREVEDKDLVPSEWTMVFLKGPNSPGTFHTVCRSCSQDLHRYLHAPASKVEVSA